MKKPGLCLKLHRTRISALRMEIMLAIKEMIGKIIGAKAIIDPLKYTGATITKIRSKTTLKQTVFKVVVCVYRRGLQLSGQAVSHIRHLREFEVCVLQKTSAAN